MGGRSFVFESDDFGHEPKPLIAVFLSLAFFLLYASGACHTIYVGDSGELVAAAATLGIPHPSGYPLYVLLGKLWITALPLGSVAFRMSLFSAAGAATAVGLLFFVLQRMGLARSPALFGALLAGTGPSFWSQANIQRVYSLNALALVMVIGAALEWHRTRKVKWLVLAAFLCGLGAANHTYVGIFGIAVALFALCTEPRLLRTPRVSLACMCAVVVGLIPYAYLPWRSIQEPRLDWGNPETLDSFLAVVLRLDFWDRAWAEKPVDFLVILADWAKSLGWELAWGGTALAMLGLLVGRKLGTAMLLPALGILANLLVVAVHGSRSDLFIWHRYYIPSYILAALLSSLGLAWVVERWGRKWAAVAMIFPLVLVITGYRHFDRSRFAIADDFSRTLLSTLPPGATLIASDDNILFILIYLQLVEGTRPDVHLVMQGVGNANIPSLSFDPDETPLYFTHHPNWQVSGLEIVPVGLVFRTLRTGQPWPAPNMPKRVLVGENDVQVPKDYLTQNLIGHFHYMLGITLESRDWGRAQQEFAQAQKAAPQNDVLFYNLGLIYARNGLQKRSLIAFKRSQSINPRGIPARDAVRAADKVELLSAEVERLAAVESQMAPFLGTEAPKSADWHRRMAELLSDRGEALAARGHLLLALEADG